MDNPIKIFYRSLQDLEPDGIRDIYHPEIIFEDPAFGELKGERAISMWEMLLKSASESGLEFQFKDIEIDGESGTGKCEAWYTFGPTGRHVHNRLKGTFRFQDGKIIEHHDHFDLYRWSRQAIGVRGLLLGWTSYFRKTLQKSTNKALDRYIASKNL